jgi:DnaK suppressor protein
MDIAPHERRWLRDRINARRAVLRAEIDAALHETPSAPIALADHRTETDDDAVADLETVLDVASLERDDEELQALEEALARLEAGEYGVCIDCGEAIPIARLQAELQAQRCVRCQERIERQFAL